MLVRMATRRSLWATVLAVALVAAVAALVITFVLLRRAGEMSRDVPWPPSVLTLAGDGVQDVVDGDATRARFVDPFGVAIGADGTIYVSDGQRIRRISLDGAVSTLASGFGWLSALAIGRDGTVYAADTGNNVVTRVTVGPGFSPAVGRSWTPIAGDFNGPIGLALDNDGRLIVADTYNDRICVIDPAGRVSTLAGGVEPGFADGAAADARFDTPSGVAVDASGRIYVADTGNGLVRVIDPSGAVTTLGGPFATFDRPIGIAVDRGGGVYVTEEAGRVVTIAPTGETRVIAGAEPGFHDGFGIDARFRSPAGVAFTAAGDLIVADAGNALVRVVQVRPPADVRPPASPFIAPQFDERRFGWQPLLWPVDPQYGPHEIAGTLGESRGDASERFHSGIDVRADQGTAVVAVRDGVVSSPISTGAFGSLNEWLRIGDLAYIHMRAGRDRRDKPMPDARFVATTDSTGKVARIRVKRGARFATGDMIGSVNAFNHVHLNVGWPGEEYNPLRFRLAQFTDTVAPTIAAGGVRVFDEAGQPFKQRRKGRLELSGRVRVVVDAWDQADGNRPNRRLGVYALGYQVLMPDGSSAPGFERMRDTLVFDRMPLDHDAPRLVYAPGSGIPFYGNRRTRFLYTVTSTFRDGHASDGLWDTTRLPPGDYTLRIKAMDFSGNEAVRNRDLPVAILELGPRDP
jgi:sugar lactone lactonase YvrE